MRNKGKEEEVAERDGKIMEGEAEQRKRKKMHSEGKVKEEVLLVSGMLQG